MRQYINLQHFFYLLLVLVVSGCASTGSNVNDSRAVLAGKWVVIGTSINGNVKHDIDTSSIRRQGNLAFYKDRKTIVDMSQERYNNTTPYKIAISEWEVDCRYKTYRLVNTKLFGDKSNLILQKQYTASELRPMKITQGSAIDKQYQQVCEKSK